MPANRERKYICRVETNWWIPKDKCTVENGIQAKGRRVLEGISYFEVIGPKGGSRIVWWVPGFKKLYELDPKIESIVERCIGLNIIQNEDDMTELNGIHDIEFTKSELVLIDAMASGFEEIDI
jgi:hypothetical protein